MVTSNVYVGTFTNISPVNADQGYKFWSSNPYCEPWETVAPINQQQGGNRYYINGSGDQRLALVDFNDAAFESGSNTAILNVSGQANPWGAGHAALPPGADGILPPLVHFQSGSNQVLIFTSVTGLVNENYNGYGFQGRMGSRIRPATPTSPPLKAFRALWTSAGSRRWWVFFWTTPSRPTRPRRAWIFPTPA